MEEGTIRWFRVARLSGVEVMDVRSVGRKWAHHHETYTLCTISQHERTPEVGWLYRGREYFIRPGGTKLMEPGEFHTNTRPAPVASFGVILLEPERFHDLVRLARGHDARTLALACPQLHDADIEQRVLSALMALRAGDPEGSEDALLQLVDRLCERRVFDLTIARKGTVYDVECAGAAREILQERWAEEVSVSQIVRELGVPASTLAHAFRRRFGMGLRQYRRRVRLERCRRMLRDDPAAVVDLAARCGFLDMPAFCHAFKTTFGMTASEYRRSVVCLETSVVPK